MKSLRFQNVLSKPDAWAKCSECGESYSQALIESGDGVCPLCIASRRSEEVAEAIAEVHPIRSSREAILSKRGFPEDCYDRPFEAPTDWPTDNGLSLANWTGEPRTVYLHGTTGTGKTFLAGELFFRAGGRGRFVAASDIPDLAIRLHQIHVLKEAPCLVVDEIARGLKGFGLDYLVDVIRHRHAWKLATIYTCNLSLDQLQERHFDSSALDRLRTGFVAEMTGRSRRK